MGVNKRMKKIYIATIFAVFMILSCISNAGEINNTNFIGIGNSKNLSGSAGVESTYKIDQLFIFSRHGKEYYVKNLEVGIGTQARLIHNEHNQMDFYATVGKTYPLVLTKIKPIMRIGASSDLDSKSGGFYGAVGAELYVLKNVGIYALLETEDSHNRNSIGLTYKY